MIFTADQFADLARTAHDPEAAEKAAALLNGELDPDTVLDRVLMLDHNERVMEALNEVLDCHGVEAIRSEGEWDRYYGDVVAVYLNTGDTYCTTVLLDTEGEFHVTSYGDWLEAFEQEQRA